jgi:hypothetical protein
MLGALDLGSTTTSSRSDLPPARRDLGLATADPARMDRNHRPARVRQPPDQPVIRLPTALRSNTGLTGAPREPRQSHAVIAITATDDLYVPAFQYDFVPVVRPFRARATDSRRPELLRPRLDEPPTRSYGRWCR